MIQLLHIETKTYWKPTQNQTQHLGVKSKAVNHAGLAAVLSIYSD